MKISPSDVPEERPEEDCSPRPDVGCLWVNNFGVGDLEPGRLKSATDVTKLACRITESVQNFTTPMLVAARLWLKINATPPAGFTGPLILQSTMTQAQFTTLQASVSTLAAGGRDLEVDLKVARERRNDLQDEIYPILKKYRQTVPTRFAAGNALIDSLPILTPDSGRTPEAPVATAQWNVTEQKGQVSFTPIDDVDVKRYKLCSIPGD